MIERTQKNATIKNAFLVDLLLQFLTLSQFLLSVLMLSNRWRTGGHLHYFILAKDDNTYIYTKFCFPKIVLFQNKEKGLSKIEKILKEISNS